MKGGPQSIEDSGRARARSARLIDKPPVAYLGPCASGALAGGCGLLLGAKRPGWVDLLSYLPHPKASYRQLVARRFDAGAEWDVVGIVLAKKDLERHHDFLLRELVPGDVILVVDEETKPQLYVNSGDTWMPARLKKSRAGVAISARSGLR